MEIVSSKSHKAHICSLRLRVHKALWPWSFKVAQSPHQANQPTGPGLGKPTYSLHIGSTYGIFTYMKGGFYGKCIGISYMDGLKTSETNTPTTQYWVFSALFREEQQKHIPPRQPALLKMVPCRGNACQRKRRHLLIRKKSHRMISSLRSQSPQNLFQFLSAIRQMLRSTEDVHACPSVFFCWGILRILTGEICYQSILVQGEIAGDATET